MMGMARIRPMAPHSHPQNNSETVTRKRVQANAPADQRRNQQIRRDDMEGRQHGENPQIGRKRVVLLQPDEERRNPRHYRAQVGDQIAQAGNKSRQEREIEPQGQKEQPARDHQNQARPAPCPSDSCAALCVTSASASFTSVRSVAGKSCMVACHTWRFAASMKKTRKGMNVAANRKE